MRLTEDSIRRRISEQLRPRRAGLGGNHETASTREAATAETAPGQSVDVSDLYGIDDHESFLREAYRRILGREVDVYGFVHFREMLRNRFPKEGRPPHFLPKTSFNRSVTRAAGSVRIFFSSCPSTRKSPSRALMVTWWSRSTDSVFPASGSAAYFPTMFL